ncbi:MAG: histidine kinase [Cyclobacteriaceae bacterium]
MMSWRIRNEVYYHILFWIVYSSIFTFVEGGYSNQFREAFYIELLYLPFRLFVVYLNYFWLLPKFLLKRRIISYLTYTLLSIVIASFTHRVAMHTYFSLLIFPNWNLGSFWQVYKFLQSAMIITSPVVFLIGVTAMGRWVTTEQRAEQLQKEKLQAELSFLRSQINPHFFFNTLNNLYGLALQKSDRTAEVVMKLSELMSYILYDADREKVPLSKEIGQIERYIALEQIRYGNRFEVDLQLSGDIDNFQIPPLLLLPFIENSFKHGINKSSSDGWVAIAIEVSENELNFRIENKIPPNQNKATENSGLGIVNTKKRLDLLFPADHLLKYHETRNMFTVELTLKVTHENYLPNHR